MTTSWRGTIIGAIWGSLLLALGVELEWPISWNTAFHVAFIWAFLFLGTRWLVNLLVKLSRFLDHEMKKLEGE